MRRAADRLDMLLGDIFNGRRKLDTPAFIEALAAMETIQSTINLVIGQPKGDD